MKISPRRRFRTRSHRSTRQAATKTWLAEKLEDRQLLTAVPLTTAHPPAGSLVYESEMLSGAIVAPGETATFQLQVDPGQRITVLLAPADELVVQADLFDSDHVVLSSAVGASAGKEVLLQSILSPNPGELTIAVEGAAGTTGPFQVRVLLNAALETESHGGPANSVLAAAQSLDDSFVSVEPGSGNGAERAAVFGRLATGTSTGDVFVVENGSGSVVHYSSVGQQVGRYYFPGGQLFDIEQGLHDDLYVTMQLDSGGGQLLHLDLNGELLGTIPLPDGQYQEPGLEVAADGSLWVPDMGSGLVHHLDAAGNEIQSFPFWPGGASDIAVRGDGLVLVTSVYGGVWQLDPQTGDVVWYADADSPRGLNFSPDGGLTVASIWGGVVYQFDSGGSLLASIPSYYAVDAQLDLSGNVWISSFYGWNLSNLDAAGNPLHAASPYYPWGLAVIGVDGASPSPELQPDFRDYYSVSLDAGQNATFLLNGLNGIPVAMQLQDAAGNLVAFSSTGPSNVDRVIRDFVAPQPGVYHVLLESAGTAPYSLLVTRNSSFDLERNDSTATAQSLGFSNQILGAVDYNLTNFADASDDPNADYYQIGARANQPLSIWTSTPADGAGDFSNRLDPYLELYDADGNLLLTDDNGALDGRNARLELTPSADQFYFVSVGSAGFTVGEYLLSVQGGTAVLPEFRVVGTDPPDGARFRGSISQVTVDFNDSVLVSSFEASDLTLDGVPAQDVYVIDSLRAVFVLPPHGDGSHQLKLRGGSVVDLQGTAISEWQSTFVEDATPPRVIRSSVQPGQVLPVGALSYVVEFSEPMATDAVGGEDITLKGQFQNVVYPATSWSWNATGTQFTVQFPSLPEDHYALTLASGDSGFEDLVGLDLDGEVLAKPVPPNRSGDGVEGGDFSVDFWLDATQQDITDPFQAVMPVGSLIYSHSINAVIHDAADTDTYSFAVDPGQAIAVVVEPQGTLQPAIELLRIAGKSSKRLATAAAAAPGEDASIQAIDVAGSLTGKGESPFTYRVKVSGTKGSSGAYRLRILLNTGLEAEEFGGAANNTRSSSQDLQNYFLPLHSGASNGSGPERAAVLGKLHTGVNAGDVFYTRLFGGSVVQLDSSGQLQNEFDYAGTFPNLLFMDIEQGIHDDLYVGVVQNDSGAGQLLRLNYDGSIAATIPLPGENYYDFGHDVAANGDIWVTQPVADQIHRLNANGQLISTFSFWPGYPLDVAVRNDGQVFATSWNGGVWQLDPVSGNISPFATADYPRGLNFAPNGDLIVAGYLSSQIYRFDSSGNLLSGFNSAANGDSQADQDGAIWTTSLGGYSLRRFDYSGNELAGYYDFYTSPNGLVVIGADRAAPPARLQRDSADNYSVALGVGDSLSVYLQKLNDGDLRLELLDPAGTVLARGMVDASAGSVVQDFVASRAGQYVLRVTGSSHTEYSLVTTRNASFGIDTDRSGASPQDIQSKVVAGRQWVLGALSPNADGLTGIGSAMSDFYRVNLPERGTLDLETMTPATGAGQWHNSLDPQLRLYDSAGNLVASNDNGAPDGRNARLRFKIPRGGGGDYTIEVAAADVSLSAQQGEYILSVKGNSGKPTSFTAVATDLIDGQRRRGPTNEITLKFNDAVDLSTLQKTDLKVNGQPATDMRVLDGRHVVFQLPSLNEGEKTVRVAAGAVSDVQGTPVDAYSVTFFEDLSAPRVISSSIQTGDILPADGFTYVAQFSEPMRIESVTPDAILLQNMDDYSRYYPDTISWSSDGTILSVSYSNVLEGNYYLSLGNWTGQFEDRATPWGWKLDGEPTGAPIPPFVSGDGVEGGDYYVYFGTDVTSAPFPTPLTPKSPQGSLIYDPVYNGQIQWPTDQDQLNIQLDGDQTITVVMTASSELRPSLEVRGPLNSTIATAQSDSAGQTVWLQTLAVPEPGTYSFVISSADGSVGNYQLQLILNAAVEVEHLGGDRNDSRAAAQDLSGSFISLPTASPLAAHPARAAVFGHLNSGVQAGDVFVVENVYGYLSRFDTYGNELATYYLPGGTLFDVEQGTGDDVYVSVRVDDGSGQLWHLDFAGNQLDTVLLPPTGDYTDTQFDVATDGSFWVTQPATSQVHWLDSSGNLLRSYDFLPGSPADVAVRGEVVVVTSSGQGGAWQLDVNSGELALFAGEGLPLTGVNFTPDGGLMTGSWTGAAYRFDDAGNLVQSYWTGWSFVPDVQLNASEEAWISIWPYFIQKFDTANNVLAGRFLWGPRGVAVIGVDGPEPSAQVQPDSGDYFSVTLEAGQTISLIMSSPALDAVTVELQDPAGSTLALGTPGSGDIAQAIHDYRVTVAGTYFVKVTGPPLAEYNLVVLRDASFDSSANDSLESPQNLDATGTVVGSIHDGDTDYFQLTVGEGDVITLATTTPAGGPGEFVNQLDPVLELYDADGNLLASDDNSGPDGRNALLSFVAPQSGAYIIRVASSNNSVGEYVLSASASPNIPMLPDKAIDVLLAYQPTTSLALPEVGNYPVIPDGPAQTVQDSRAHDIVFGSADFQSPGTAIHAVAQVDGKGRSAASAKKISRWN